MPEGKIVVASIRLEKRGTMKIDKEVAITASTADVWSFLTNEETLTSVWGEKVVADFRKNGIIRFPGRKIQQKVKIIRPKEQLSLCMENESVCLTTTYRLVPRGKRTMLKVTISGWEMMDQQQARREVPRVSLEWEKRLGVIKRTLEAARVPSD
jgi:uncharacterized protein YndB with AHSA1/START domain